MEPSLRNVRQFWVSIYGVTYRRFSSKCNCAFSSEKSIFQRKRLWHKILRRKQQKLLRSRYWTLKLLVLNLPMTIKKYYSQYRFCSAVKDRDKTKVNLIQTFEQHRRVMCSVANIFCCYQKSVRSEVDDYYVNQKICRKCRAKQYIIKICVVLSKKNWSA